MPSITALLRRVAGRRQVAGLLAGGLWLVQACSDDGRPSDISPAGRQGAGAGMLTGRKVHNGGRPEAADEGAAGQAPGAGREQRYIGILDHLEPDELAAAQALRDRIQQAQRAEAVQLDRLLAMFGPGLGDVRPLGDHDSLGQHVDHLPGPQPVCIVSHHTPAIEPFASIAQDNHARYASRQGYHAIHFRGFFGGTRYMNAAAEWPPQRYGMFWEKILAVERAMDMTTPGGEQLLCDWLMWADADVLVTALDRPIDQVIAPWAGEQARQAGRAVDIVVARDASSDASYFINAGVFFVRNTPTGRGFIADILALFPKLQHDWHRFHLGDQDAIECLLTQSQPEDLPTSGWRTPDLRLDPRIGVAPQRAFNAFSPRSDGNNLDASTWKYGDFVAHFAGREVADRTVTMRRMADDVAAWSEAKR